MKLSESSLRKIVYKLVEHSSDFIPEGYYASIPRHKGMDQETLKLILTDHQKWIDGDPSGVLARLSHRILMNLDMHRVNLRSAFLNGANLTRSNLSGANLEAADIRNAYLNFANLTGANFRRASLYRADVRNAKFTTELLDTASLRELICDDDQLPWLIPNKTFSRVS